MPETIRPDTNGFAAQSKGIAFWKMISGRFNLVPLESNGTPEGVPFRYLLTGKFKLVPVVRKGRARKRRQESSAVRINPRTSAFVFVLVGCVLLIGSIVTELLWRQESLFHKLSLQLMGHIGIAAIVLGAVGISIELKHWSEYFEDRLASTIGKKEFLETQTDQELDALLERVFLSRFRVHHFDTNSFLNFFRTRIQGFIGSAFRQEVRRTMTLTGPDPRNADLYQATLHVRYTCRKISGESSTIQEDVLFDIDHGDIGGRPADYRITLKIPRHRRKNFISPAGFPPYKDGKIVLTRDDLKRLADKQFGNKGEVTEAKKNEKGEMEGSYRYWLSLRDFSDMDGLAIRQYAEYSIRLGRFNSWANVYPSKDVAVIFKYPDDVDLKVETLGMDPVNLDDPVESPGLYSLEYDSWVLPHCGVIYSFFKKPPDPIPHPASPPEIGDPAINLNAIRSSPLQSVQTERQLLTVQTTTNGEETLDAVNILEEVYDNLKDV